MFVKNGDFVKNVVFKTEQVIIQQTQQGTTNRRCYIVGNGNSMTLNDNNQVIEHDPLMSYFVPKVSKEYSAYVFYYTFSADLISAGKDITTFFDTLSAEYHQNFLVGHSKCSITLYTTAATYGYPQRINLVTVSPPVLGTQIANKKFVHSILKRKFLIKLYDSIFSDHIVDRDIMPGAEAIKNLAKMKLNSNTVHINIKSKFRTIFSCRNPLDLLLYWLDKKLRLEGDGMVPFSSQDFKNASLTKEFNCSHLCSLNRTLKYLESL